MVSYNVITKKCNVTGKIITGINRNEFNKNWAAHLESLKKMKEEQTKKIQKSNIENIEKNIKKIKTQKKKKGINKKRK